MRCDRKAPCLGGMLFFAWAVKKIRNSGFGIRNEGDPPVAAARRQQALFVARFPRVDMPPYAKGGLRRVGRRGRRPLQRQFGIRNSELRRNPQSPRRGDSKLCSSHASRALICPLMRKGGLTKERAAEGVGPYGEIARGAGGAGGASPSPTEEFGKRTGRENNPPVVACRGPAAFFPDGRKKSFFC